MRLRITLTTRLLYCRKRLMANLVRLDGALTGVEAQINETYSPDAYKTAEEFQQLANEHFIKSLTLSINDQPIIVVNPSVQLGHATQFSAEAQGIDHTIESIDLTNTFFKDLHGNRMTVVLLSDQFPKTQYTLNDSNQHRLSLQLVDGQWQQNSSDALLWPLMMHTLMMKSPSKRVIIIMKIAIIQMTTIHMNLLIHYQIAL